MSSYKEKRVLFEKELERINAEHTPEDWEKRNPYNWKKEWGPFIQYQADWDGSYFLELVIYKLERMYAELDIFSDEVRKDLNKKLKILKSAIDLGKKIQTFDYFAPSDAFSKEHCAQVIHIYDNDGKKGMKAMLSKKLLAVVPQEKVSFEDCNYDEENFDIGELMGNRNADQWIKDHGYTKDQVHYAYAGEWDDMKNHDIWFAMVKKDAKAEQADIDKFFKIIARHYRDWWW